MQMPDARTLPDLIDEMARRFPEREALVGGDQRYTYAALRTSVRRLAKSFHALGLRKGDKAAILMGNRCEWVLADLAITTLGGTMVAVNTWSTLRELEHVLAHSDTSILVCVNRFLKHDYLDMLDRLQPHATRLPALREIVCLSQAPSPSGVVSWSEFTALGGDVPDKAIDDAIAAIAPTDIAYLLYTSGSTSTPKGVRLRHDGLIENMWNIGERMRVTERDRLWLAVSLFWGLGCENALLNMLTHGACTVLQEHFEPGEALELIERERCSVFYATPNMVAAMADHPDRPRRDLSSLRTGGTLGTPEQIMRVVDLGAREICHIYGLTETYGNCCVTDAHDPLGARLETVGRPLEGVDLRIVDAETGGLLPAGQVGEIRVKGYVTPGYYKDEDKNEEAFDAEGYFRTGDLGLLDGEGRLRFRGRIKEMVKTGGINVAPVEVEEILRTHEAVELAFVVGVPDAVRDEVLAAVIVTKPGRCVSAEDLRAHCRDALAAYKVPRFVRFVSEAELPTTTTGKLQKNRLPSLFSEDTSQ